MQEAEAMASKMAHVKVTDDETGSPEAHRVSVVVIVQQCYICRIIIHIIIQKGVDQVRQNKADNETVNERK